VGEHVLIGQQRRARIVYRVTGHLHQETGRTSKRLSRPGDSCPKEYSDLQKTSLRRPDGIEGSRGRATSSPKGKVPRTDVFSPHAIPELRFQPHHLRSLHIMPPSFTRKAGVNIFPALTAHFLTVCSRLLFPDCRASTMRPKPCCNSAIAEFTVHSEPKTSLRSQAQIS
jgi:hypothetical protein